MTPWSTEHFSKSSATSFRLDRLSPSTPSAEIRRSRPSPARSSSYRSRMPRYAINAANARWGSLYDALYGTDALGDLPAAGPYDTVARRAGHHLGVYVSRRCHSVGIGQRRRPFDSATATYRIVEGTLAVTGTDGLSGGLADPSAFTAYTGDPDKPDSILLVQHGLGIEIVLDRDHPIGAADPAGIADVVLESAVTSIMDFEDSVAAVDSADKAVAYRNWLGLMTGALDRGRDQGRSHLRPATRRRSVVHGRRWDAADVSGPRPAARPQRRPSDDHARRARRDRNPVPEGLLDAMITVLWPPRLARSAATQLRPARSTS